MGFFFVCLILGIFKVSFDVLVRGVGELKMMMSFCQQQKTLRKKSQFKRLNFRHLLKIK